jgi:SAM-dependent methyltransferase
MSNESTLRLEALSSCPICFSPHYEVAFVSPDFLHGVPGDFTYCECQRCRTMFQNPRIAYTDIAASYPRSYFTHQDHERGQIRTSGTWQDQLRWKVLDYADGRVDRRVSSPALSAIAWILSRSSCIRRRARFGLPDALGLDVPGRRCLEIGPGAGTELLLLAHLGWAAEGLEFDPVAATMAEQTSACKVSRGSLESCNFAPKSFDLIYGSHVVEHLFDAVSSLEHIFNLLRPGGKLLMIYPNRDSLVARRYGRYAPTWDPPRHISLLPAATMVDVLQRIGFHPVTIEVTGRRGRHWASIARSRWKERQSKYAPRMTPDWMLGIAERLAPSSWRLGEELAAIAIRPGP